MLGASLIKAYGFVDFVLETGISVPAAAYVCLAVASIVAFAVSMLCIKLLMNFVKKHDFKVFGWYRIALGLVVLGVFIVPLLFA